MPDDGRVLKAVVAAAILLGAGDLEEAAAAAGRVPDLSGAPAGELRRWARWLYALYPGGPGARLGSVQPDLLAEHHVATQFAADPGLARSILTDLDARQAAQALTVLARAWDVHENAGQVIETALRADLAGLAIPAADVAVQTQAKAGAVLAAALDDAPATLEDLIRIQEALPYPSVTMANAALAAAQRIRRELPPDSNKQDIARWADRSGVLFSQADRPGDALVPAQEAVTIRRELAAALPDRYRPELANSLTNLGIRFSELGRPADALPPAQEAVTIYRELAAAIPDRYRPDLAVSLTNLSDILSALGRSGEATTAYREAQENR